MITLPHSANQKIPVKRFLAAWIIWAEQLYNCSTWEGFHFPFNWKKEKLATIVGDGRLSGLDAMVRFLAHPAARNTMQISDDFLAVNAEWLNRCYDALSPSSRDVSGAVLTDRSIDLWNAIPEQEKNNILIETAQLASEFFESMCGIEEVDSEEENISQPASYAPDSSTTSFGSSLGWVQKFVEMVDCDPFVPHYRCKPIVAKVGRGWGHRLSTYFWPTPVCGLSFTTAALSPHIATLQHLANKVLAHTPWSSVDQGLAVKSAMGVFQWGRVLRSAPTPDQVRAAMEMAIHCSSALPAPPMNSTWTKLAAFSTEHLTHPQVIWDSRVATAVICRLERLFIYDGLTTVPYGSPEIPHNLGPMQVGRGGTRPRKLKLNWTNAYGRWSALYAASEFVRTVRDYLNANPTVYSKFSSQAPWTLREVEQVLFMDGY